jgi:hypothetical protein
MLKTRLDGRSEENNTLLIKDQDDNIIATIKVANKVKVELEVDTIPNTYVAKRNGWESK